MLPFYVSVLVPVVAVLYVLRKLTQRSWGRCSNQKSLRGKVFVITGANSGLGKETARMLACKEAKVIMGCRDMVAARKAVEDIRLTTSSGELIPLRLDLASLESINTFAEEVLQICPEVHVLINNAGISLPPGDVQRSEDGFEIHFSVNYFGHFVLTNRLLNRIKSSAPSRVVNVASLLHTSGEIDFTNLNGERRFPLRGDRFAPAYCNTKLCNVYHAMELGRRLQGSGVKVYTLCPGWCHTGLMRHFSMPWYNYIAVFFVGIFFMRSANAGAQTILKCAIDDDLTYNYRTFGFYRNCRPFKSRIELDPAIGTKLWTFTETLLTAKSNRTDSRTSSTN